MAEIRQNISGIDAQFGQGLERAHFSHIAAPHVSEWVKKRGFIPLTISERFFMQSPAATPQVLALFRDTAHLSLLEGLTVDQPKRQLNKFLEMGFDEFGPIREEQTDNSRTTDYVIPIGMKEGKGAVEIVVNSAWGVQWRISTDHPLAKRHPELTMYQQPDMGTPPRLMDHSDLKRKYIGPDTLASTTERILKPLNSHTIATELKFLLTELALLPKESRSIKVSVSSRKGHFDNKATSLSMSFGEGIELLLHIGSKTGEKAVELKVENEANEGLIHDAKRLASIIDNFYNLS